ncbi:leucine--tRNA ligase, mitochondrial-like isoform X2 [Convolutriloba macropyga]
MFPYPSGNLHMGHVRVYTLSNLFAQFYRMKGYDVIHPIGWDAFGLPAENAAIERGVDTATWTRTNIESMHSQLDRLDLCLDWSREVVTSDPRYYKWTQWLFLQMFKAGLAYRANSTVNWDPVDKTVLANEQVDDQGKSWRSGAVVQKRRLKQWFLAVSRYSKSLLEGTENLPLWPKHVKELQRQWIGKDVGVSFVCDVVNSTNEIIDTITIFSHQPETVENCTSVLASRDNFLLGQHCKVRNPLNGTLMNVTLWDHKNQSESDRVIFETEKNFAKQKGEINSQVNTSTLEKFASSRKSLNCFVSTSKVRDWLISRQRFWGAPIPIVHCECCGTVPVPESDLPVLLPEREPGKNVLSDYNSWVETSCPKCGGKAKRESDTMDTFVDSSWYFLRYLDPNNDLKIYDQKNEQKFMPVDLYIGGIEHARMHLLYARFIMHVLYDLKQVSHKEPFSNLLCQGLMLSQSYKIESSGQYVSPEWVSENKTNELVFTKTGERIATQYEKMSKSKYNGINPDDLVEKYGSDTVKCYVLDNVNPMKEIFYNPRNMMGVIRWRNRLWILVTNFINYQSKQVRAKSRYVQSKKEVPIERVWDQRNKAVVSFQNMNCFEVDELRPDKTMRQTQALTNMLKTFDVSFYENSIFQRSLLDLVIMVSPFMPLVCSEIWSGLADNVNSGLKRETCYDFSKDVLQQSWPVEVKLSDL